MDNTRRVTAQMAILNHRKKNDYRALEAGAYPRMFIEQLEKAAAGLAISDLTGIKMVRINKRTSRIDITMGFGPNNTWFENDVLPRGEYAECASFDEALSAVQFILERAQAGEFDAALEKLRADRQAHAQKMIESRDVTGFNRQSSGRLGQKALTFRPTLEAWEAEEAPAEIFAKAA